MSHAFMISGLRQSSKLSDNHLTVGEFQKATGKANNHKTTEVLVKNPRYILDQLLGDFQVVAGYCNQIHFNRDLRQKKRRFTLPCGTSPALSWMCERNKTIADQQLLVKLLKSTKTIEQLAAEQGIGPFDFKAAQAEATFYRLSVSL
jgi:hypothetical protein